MNSLFFDYILSFKLSFCTFSPGSLLWLSPFRFADKMHSKTEPVLKWALWFLMLKWNKTILSSYRTGSGFLMWMAESFLSFEPDCTSDRSRSGGFVPAVTLTFDRLLVTLVFQQINLIVLLTLILSNCGQNLKLLRYTKKLQYFYSNQCSVYRIDSISTLMMHNYIQEMKDNVFFLIKRKEKSQKAVFSPIWMFF